MIQRDWNYGIIVEGDLPQIMTALCTVLKELNFEWKIGSKDFKLKVRKVIDDSIPLDESAIDNYIKKNFLKFTMHVQRVSKTEDHRYIVNFILERGTTMLFLDFFSDFNALLEKQDLNVLFSCQSDAPTIIRDEEEQL